MKRSSIGQKKRKVRDYNWVNMGFQGIYLSLNTNIFQKIDPLFSEIDYESCLFHESLV
jgi:hypothetical protein